MVHLVLFFQLVMVNWSNFLYPRSLPWWSSWVGFEMLLEFDNVSKFPDYHWNEKTILDKKFSEKWISNNRDSHENRYLPHFDARWNSSNRWWNKFAWRLLRILGMRNGIHWFICFGICLVPISCFSSVRTLISLGVIFRIRWKPMGFGRMNFFILIDKRISFHVTLIKFYFVAGISN